MGFDCKYLHAYSCKFCNVLHFILVQLLKTLTIKDGILLARVLVGRNLIAEGERLRWKF